MTASDVEKELRGIANREKAGLLGRYFKTGVGGYAEGDKFLGIMVPLQRNIAKKYSELPLGEIKKLLASDIHEFRFTALKILVLKYEKASEKDKARIVAFYLKNRKNINNWDLVDTSAPYILGGWLINNDRAVLYELVKSKNIWDRRIAIVSTAFLIRNNDFKDTLSLSKILLNDKHDLIHKAVGWMLREVGKRSEATLVKFLNENCAVMPRTMLRYSIEKFPKTKQKTYLSGKIGK
ncbi:MAG: DNA alkylation repair protein [Candidatus Pacebacteria bacterium]|nr:DNA alkylation repair protein [Candidatus Paceibacterota bacterium]